MHVGFYRLDALTAT